MPKMELLKKKRKSDLVKSLHSQFHTYHFLIYIILHVFIQPFQNKVYSYV